MEGKIRSKWRIVVALVFILAMMPIFATPVTPAAAANITVDVNGNADYTTITAALAVAGDSDTVIVCPGTYDTASGETFPLQITQTGLTLKSQWCWCHVHNAGFK